MFYITFLFFFDRERKQRGERETRNGTDVFYQSKIDKTPGQYVVTYYLQE